MEAFVSGDREIYVHEPVLTTMRKTMSHLASLVANAAAAINQCQMLPR